MLWNRYKEYALKWRKQEKERVDKFLKGWAEAELTLILSNGDEVKTTMTRPNGRSDVGFLSDEWVERSAVDKIKEDFPKVAKRICECGGKVGSSFYSPNVIVRVDIGEITEHEE
jgi:hypothetical protein